MISQKFIFHALQFFHLHVENFRKPFWLVGCGHIKAGASDEVCVFPDWPQVILIIKWPSENFIWAKLPFGLPGTPRTPPSSLRLDSRCSLEDNELEWNQYSEKKILYSPSCLMLTCFMSTSRILLTFFGFLISLDLERIRSYVASDLVFPYFQTAENAT